MTIGGCLTVDRAGFRETIMRESASPSTMPEARDDIDLTPMLDIVFIMLIFFLVVASFTSEYGLDLNQSEGPPIPLAVNENILVTIGADNLVRIGERLIDPRAIRANIERLRAGNPGAAVIIRADKQSANKTLVQVMDASRQAGVYELSLASPEP